MNLQVLLEETAGRDPPAVVPVLGSAGLVSGLRGYASKVEPGSGGDNVDVRRDLLRLVTCT